VLLSKFLDVRICDFNLSIFASDSVETASNLNPNVQSRWYRAPELVMSYGQDSYDSKIDMWSIGCILFQMLFRKVLFDAESTE